MTLTQLPPDSELRQLQQAFTAHLRNPDLVPVPKNLNARRMGIYSGLIFHNISSLVSEFFPVIYAMSSTTEWDNLIREFFITYKAETPYFPKLAEEFLNFLMSREGNNDAPDHFLSLAHYEWLELGLFISMDEPPEQVLNSVDLRSKHIVLSPLAVPVAYNYPVHQIQSGWEAHEAATYLLIFRDQDDDVRFFELQALAFELLNAMQTEGGINIVEWLKKKAVFLKQTDVDSFVDQGMGLVQQFNAERLFLLAVPA